MNAATSNLSRRQLLKVGVLGGGFTLAQYLRLHANDTQKRSRRSAVLIFLRGGPSHQDTFDLKPEAPAEYRGEFKPMSTAVPGLKICEHMPQLAKRANHFAVIRGISHNLAAHGLGMRYLMTGNRPTPVLKYPAYGSVVSREYPSAADLPSFVSIDESVEGPGYLGAEYGALSTGEKPRYGFPFRVRGVTLNEGITIEKYRSRRKLLKDVDTVFQAFDQLDDQVRGLDRFSDQARQIISSPRTRNAFDLSREGASEIDRFGKHEFGQSLLLTTRLIEAGVHFVTVLLDNWDTHQNNFDELAGNLLPPFDQSLSAFIDRLQERRLLASTSILVTGEFGRTPKVNGRAGRDHWARAMSALMAGGDVQGGQAIGATDDQAAEPVGDGFTPDDLAASFFQNIGIDPRQEYRANVGRPVTLIRDGLPIRELFS